MEDSEGISSAVTVATAAARPCPQKPLSAAFLGGGACITGLGATTSGGAGGLQVRRGCGGGGSYSAALDQFPVADGSSVADRNR